MYGTVALWSHPNFFSLESYRSAAMKILLFLSPQMLLVHTKIGLDWPGSFIEEFKNIQRLTHKYMHCDRQRPIAIDHPIS